MLNIDEIRKHLLLSARWEKCRGRVINTENLNGTEVSMFVQTC